MLLAALTIFSLSACSDDENNTTPQSKPTYDMTGFAKGADVSWLSEMEKAGSKFYNASGAEQDCMTLLPLYLRAPQAERERAAKLAAQQKEEAHG